MKHILILLAFIVSGCGVVNAQALANTTEYQSTPSPIPTATTGYQATANAAETQVYIAQATADEARRINAMATLEYERLVNERMQATAQVEANAQIRAGWTATAAATSIPLTATAQKENSTAIASYNTVTAAQLTATAALPTQIVAVSNAKTQAKFSDLFAGIQIFAMFSLAVFLLYAAGMMRWYYTRQDKRDIAASPQGVAERHGYKPIPPVQPEVQFIQSEPETVITVKQNYGGGNMHFDRYTVPCTKAALLQFAENVLTKNWTLAINQWESAETLFTRGTFGQLRSWLQSNGFAASTGSGTLALTDAGRAFLDAFLNASQLPTEYQFGEVT